MEVVHRGEGDQDVLSSLASNHHNHHGAVPRWPCHYFPWPGPCLITACLLSIISITSITAQQALSAKTRLGRQQCSHETRWDEGPYNIISTIRIIQCSRTLRTALGTALHCRHVVDKHKHKQWFEQASLSPSLSLAFSRAFCKIIFPLWKSSQWGMSI